jgi:bifunctional non-homologous end joining protein LigD
VAVNISRAYIPTVPTFVRPCIPAGRKSVPPGEAWLHELKLDGYRFQIAKEGRQVRLYSGCGTEWTRRLPGFTASFLALPCLSALLDGELVLPDGDGAPEIEGEVDEHELVFFAFDLLHRDGKDLRHLPLIERRRRLVRLVCRAEVPCLHLVEAFDDGAALLRAAERHGLNGIVSKRRDARYRSGECSDWVSVINVQGRTSDKPGRPSAR